ncbi:hypothetical protein MTR67_022266 [Solanum verrucosum]|uniref:Uncharacterized protein n=1 Tax=Solanum verrucosum TaxID=315347 RepID=A0AAF0TQM4_SOLVR|nr:hypothetical protein MTR67_022266 [Solanum verrucosum]
MQYWPFEQQTCANKGIMLGGLRKFAIQACILLTT